MSNEELAKIYSAVHDFFVEDEIVLRVLRKIEQRSEQGMITYGVSLKGDTRPLVDWLREAQEEALDQALYIEKIIDELSGEANEK
jgi:hypothetical protein